MPLLPLPSFLSHPLPPAPPIPSSHSPTSPHSSSETVVPGVNVSIETVEEVDELKWNEAHEEDKIELEYPIYPHTYVEPTCTLHWPLDSRWNYVDYQE